VRVVYSDESGTGSERDEPVTVVAGVMLNADHQWHPTLQSIESALRSALGRDETSNFEIRGRNLYHQVRRGDEKAHTLLSELLLIPKQQRLPIFYGAVDRAGYKLFMQKIYIPSVRAGRNDEPMGTLDTFKQALDKCMNLLDSYVHAAFPEEQVLWIHDKGMYDDHAKEQLNFIRSVGSSGLSEFLRLVEIGYLQKSHIVDTVYFGDSRESRALQLADVCCSTITRYLRGDTIAVPYYELLRRQIVNDGARREHENMETTIEELRKRTGNKTRKW
jgi:hypothetical protein